MGRPRSTKRVARGERRWHRFSNGDQFSLGQYLGSSATCNYLGKMTMIVIFVVVVVVEGMAALIGGVDITIDVVGLISEVVRSEGNHRACSGVGDDLYSVVVCVGARDVFVVGI